MRVVTWNVHGFVGADGRRDPERTARALQELEPDLVALQEVDARSRHGEEPHPLDLLAARLEARPISGSTLGTPGRDYGNAVLSRLPVLEVRRHDISEPQAEPRGAVDVRAQSGERLVRLVATHFGLRRRERIAQATRVATKLDDGSTTADVLVVAGDLNSWWPSGREGRILERAVGSSLRPRTFPARRPLLRLDRVFVRPEGCISRWGVADDPRSRTASDHLPVWVDLEP